MIGVDRMSRRVLFSRSTTDSGQKVGCPMPGLITISDKATWAATDESTSTKDWFDVVLYSYSPWVTVVTVVASAQCSCMQMATRAPETPPCHHATSISGSIS